MAEVKERIAELMFKFLKKDLSPDEERELNAWISSSETNRELFERLTDEESFHSNVREIYSYKTETWKKIESETGVGRVVYMRRTWIKWVAAASIILVLGIGGYLFFVNKKSGDKGTETTVAKMNDVPAPNSTKAMITLADGTKVYLDSVGSGTIAQQSNVQVMRTEDGRIIYNREDAKAQGELVYNTLSNPKGSRVIDMTLSDGSHVWLNAGSSVTYPVAFVGNERKVEITGEAYFEVAHDASKPFVVSKGETSVTVLGTHFNVNAYDDEDALRVTLLEGSVSVKSEVGGQKSEKIIKPGQQAKAVSGELSVVSNVDVDEVMAWKNGFFSFNDADVRTMMRQLSRWYDLDVVFEGPVSGERFTGEIDRNISLAKLLDNLAKSRIHFRVEGKKVTVMK